MELAAMLSQIGFVTIPQVVLLKYRGGHSLTGAEQDMIARAPEVGAKLLANIPRLENVARFVAYQQKNFDGSGYPADDMKGEDLPIASRILKVLSGVIEAEQKGAPKFKILTAMQQTLGAYDPRVLDAAFACFDVYLEESSAAAVQKIRPIQFKDLQPGHILARDIRTAENTLLVTGGSKISPALIEKLRNFAQISGVKEPIHIHDELLAA